MSPDLSRFNTRLVPARGDLAAAHLRDEVDAARFVRGTPMRVTAPLADLTLVPDRAAMLATQLLCGEPFTVYETRAEGLSWGQSARDGYVGYVPTAALGPARPDGARITALRSHVYVAPTLKARVAGALPLLADVDAGPREGGFVAVPGGYVPAPHLEPVPGDLVDHALRLVGVPYLWGGRSAEGLDCSALVQLAMAAAGLDAPRDSDMQEAMLGRALPEGAPGQRGDLLFWKGHVGILVDAATLLHANATHMAVACEPCEGAIARIAAAGDGPVTSRRRLPALAAP